MNHNGTQTIKTDRLILRKFVLDDAKAMYNNWANDERVTKFLTWPTYTSVDNAVERMQLLEKEYQNDAYYNWAICEADIDEPIGNISVVHLKDRISTAHIGYCLGYNWWNKGYMTEALRAVIKFLFESEKFNRIESSHSTENPASGIVMKKAGMIYEGTSRQADKSNYGISDLANYAILYDDYMKN